MNPEPVLELRDVRLHGDAPAGSPSEPLRLALGPGEFAVIAGRSGSEKSRLLLTAAGLLKPLEGSVRLLGLDLASRRAEDSYELRRRTGFVFQEPVFISELSALDNALLPLRYDGELTEAGIQERARRVLEAARLAFDAQALTDRLSPLDRRKLGLARAWARGPEIVFYDEPARGLDPAAQKTIIELIGAYHRSGPAGDRPCAAVLTCSDPRWTLDFADQFWVLGHGSFKGVEGSAQIRARRSALESQYWEAINAT